MQAGYTGVFAIPWAQTFTDGMRNAPLALLQIGARWSWTGQAATRLDGPQNVLRLDAGTAAAQAPAGAARRVHRLAGSTGLRTTRPPPGIEEAAQSPCGAGELVLTDGRNAYSARLITAPDGAPRLLAFDGAVPAPGAETWVAHLGARAAASMPRRIRCIWAGSSGDGAAAGNAPGKAGTVATEGAAPASRKAGLLIGLLRGTHIATPAGATAVERLEIGDLVQTADAGAQPVMWVGQWQLSGARLYTDPALRPVRIRAHAMGPGRPDRDLHVAPRQRVVLRGPAAQALFNTAEVLAAAEDLRDDMRILRASGAARITCHAVLLARPHLLCANGLDVEGLHPAHPDYGFLPSDPHRAAMPAAAQTPGPPLRRALCPAEAAILCHAGARGY